MSAEFKNFGVDGDFSKGWFMRADKWIEKREETLELTPLPKKPKIEPTKSMKKNRRTGNESIRASRRIVEDEHRD